MVSELTVKGYKKTTIGVVPDHWVVKTFNDLLDEKIIKGIQDGNHGEIHPKSADYVSTGIPFVMANNLKKGTVDLDSCNFISKELGDRLRIGFSYPGDVLLSHKGTVGRVAIVPEVEEYVMLTPQVTYYRVSDTKKLSNYFLKYFFESNGFQSILSKLSSQSTRNYIGITSQKKLPTVLPPIGEQKKIVSILSSVDKAIEKTGAIIEQTEQVKKGLTHQLLTKGIGHTKYKKTEIGEIPKEWEVSHLSKHCQVNPTYRLEKGTICDYVEMAAVSTDSPHVAYFDKREAGSGSGSRFKNGDVVFARITPCTENGKTALISNMETEIGIGSTEFIVLSPITNKMDNKFLYYLVKWDKIRSYAISKMVGTTGRQRVPKEVFNEELIVAFPSLDEQKKIGEILWSCDQKIAKEMSYLEQLEVLKKGLMQSLLTGKVRVKVDEAEVTQV